MDLTHKFTVPASVEDTWAAFNDIESVAGCFPGATVTSVEGDEFKGSCKVKLGPIALVYNGSGTFTERDDSAHRFVVEAKGKDKRGNGTAGATVTAVLTAGGGDSTDVEVRTDLAITGKPAQFGRGVIQDVSDKLLQQFVECLESRVGQQPSGEGSTERPSGEETPVGGGAGGAVDGGVGGAGSTVDGSAVNESGAGAMAEAAADAAGQGVAGATASARKAPSSTYSGVSAGADAGASTARGVGKAADDALDLGATVLPILLRSYWRPLAGLAAVFLVLWAMRRGRRG